MRGLRNDVYHRRVHLSLHGRTRGPRKGRRGGKRRGGKGGGERRLGGRCGWRDFGGRRLRGRRGGSRLRVGGRWLGGGLCGLGGRRLFRVLRKGWRGDWCTESRFCPRSGRSRRGGCGSLCKTVGFCVKIISAVTHYYFVCCLSTPYLDRGV